MLTTTLMPVGLNEKVTGLRNMAGFIRHFGTEKVYLCHVMPGESEERRKRVLKRLNILSEIFSESGLKTETLLREGVVGQQVCSLARELQVDYLSLKWRSKNALHRSIIGSSDEDILRICNYPTFVYKDRGLLESGVALRTILLATDFKLPASKLDPFLSAAARSAESLYILHVRGRAPDPVTDHERSKEVKAKLEELMMNYTSACQRVEPLEVVGSPRTEIPKKARKLGADMVLIGRKDTKSPVGRLMGSVAESVSHRCKASVMIIP